jgi:hypothetical protein
MARHPKSNSADRSHRFKEPVSPSVRGTGKQSEREDKGPQLSISHHASGTGHPSGHGRGGKADRG